MTALFEHFHEAVTTPEDVDKLKKLILKLAMQGKLLEQDPNDEPASELMKKIEEEKQRLIKEKKIKKPKALPPISEEEKPYELPIGWEWVRLGDISQNVHYGHTASATTENTGVKFVRITDIQDSRVIWDNVPYCEIEEKKLSNLTLSNKDILIARTGGTIGKSFIVENIEHTAVFASYLIRVVLYKINLQHYIKWFLESDLYWKQLQSKSQGTGQPNVNATSLSNLVVPLPPLSEQKRIVHKIKEMFKQCDRLSSNIVKKQTTSSLLNKSVFTRLQDHSNPEQLNDLRFVIENMEHLCNDKESIAQLRNSILSLAVRGKLVEQDANDEPALVLVAKIKEEKERLVAEKKIKKEKPLPPITPEEIPYELPKGWEWVRLGVVIELISGQHITADNYNNEHKGIPYLTGPSDFKGEGVNISRWTELPKVMALKGDLLITVKGSGVGKMAVLDKGDASIGRQIMAIRSIETDIDYIRILLKLFGKQLNEMSVGIAIPGISREDILYMLLPLPPLEEQKRIVKKVDYLFSIILQIENAIITNQHSKSILIKSYLTELN
ncbi:restriction endonuclease subunit S [Bacillus sp. UMB0899]|nr:restriction endonuclease subunit S [Bacillus sp. UMB0899]